MEQRAQSQVSCAPLVLRRAKLVVFSVCRVVTEVDDHQCASCFAETEKQFFNDNVNLNDNLNFLGLSIIEVEQKERFFCEAGFFHDEIEIPERVTILVIRLSGCSHTSRIIADNVKNSLESSISEMGFYWFLS